MKLKLTPKLALVFFLFALGMLNLGATGIAAYRWLPKHQNNQICFYQDLPRV